jgi:DNA-binding transcriptional regulator YiaG
MKRASNPRKMQRRDRGWRLQVELRAWRHAHKLSQSKAAIKLQISIRTLQEWEQGRAVPRGIALVALRKLIAR